MDRIGTTLGGRYRLGAKIGTGGMSDVYTATDELLGRDVAVKMMRPDLARDTNFLERFRREAQNAAKLNHQAIVAVYDTGQTPESDGAVPYIVMERVYGETLRDILNDRGKMSLTDASETMAQVCDALYFSHEAGIIHRDIKPANIMITNTGMVKVMDFGIARALSDSSAAMTQTAAVIGTAQYLSPEQARGKSADSRSDIYAAGCVFFELCTGRPPFQGESPFSVAFQHVQDQVMHPSTVPGMHLSKREALSLDSIVLTAMAKDPGDRYDDTRQMATDLRRLADDQLPLVAQAYVNDSPESDASANTETTVIPRQGLGAAGAGAAAGAAAGLGAGAAAGGAAAGAGQQGYSDEYADDYPEDYQEGRGSKKSGRGKGAVALMTVAALALVGAGGYIGYQLFDDNDGGPKQAQNKDVQLPDIANLDRNEAENKLNDLGLSVEVEEIPHQDIPRGKAIGTDPAVGSTLPAGATVKLLVSSGKEITEVPDLTGMTTEQAAQALGDAKLSLASSVSEESSDSVPEGQIISQSPPQGSQVSAGTKVNITVSTGKEMVTVPSVTGENADTARSNLESAGLRVTVREVDSPEPLNQVISTSNEGEEVEKGTEITLKVSKNNQFTMPSVTGKRFNEVAGILRGAGWSGSNVDRHNVNTNDLLRVDQVADQSIQPGSTVDKNASISVGVFVFSLVP